MRAQPRQRVAAWLHHLPGPAAGAITAALIAIEEGTPLESGLLAFVTLLAAGTLINRRPGWADLLPLMGVMSRGVYPLFAGAALYAVDRWTGLAGSGPLGLLAITAVASLAAVLGAAGAAAVRGPDRRIRVALVGSVAAASALQRELAANSRARFRVVGRIELPGEDAAGGGEVPTLGALEDLGRVAEAHGIELLLITGDVPRLRVFEEISNSCLHLPMRLQEVTGFYEDVFGHVPVGEINAAWFQYIMHPAYTSGAPLAKRALDLVVTLVLLLPAALVIGVCALVIRRDGGPALFHQDRIGEGGTRFTIYKLRTMRTNDETAWAGADDQRITRIGRFLRRTHLDELPQIVNVLRGEMSIVGPRPEQPAFVERLENVVPFYSRRHLIKPGLTGWAQIRCGYAGSDVGSAWKVSHDLYYLKHRSMWLDLVILGETLRTLVADPQYTAEPATVDFILRSTPDPIDDGALPGPLVSGRAPA